MNKFSQKVIASGMSLVLAVGLTPLPAFAATGDLAAGSSKLTAQEQKSLGNAEVAFNVTTTHVYDGAVFAPEPVVTYYGRTLTKGTDYTLKYQKWEFSYSYYDEDGNYHYSDGNRVDVAAPKDTGTYYAVVTGIGAYEGENSAPFSIVENTAWNDEAEVDIVGYKTTFAFTGSAIKPEIIVKLAGTVLTPNVDYTVKYQQEQYVDEERKYVDVNPTEAGSYRIEVTPAGKYATTNATPKTRYFNIENMKDLGNAEVVWPGLQGSRIQYTGQNLAPKPVVYMDGKELKEGTDYTIKYQSGTSEWDSVKYEWVYPDATPNAVGSYRVYILGIGNYASTTTEPNDTYSWFSVYAGKELNYSNTTVTWPQGNQFAYTGQKIQPKPIVMYRGTTLVEGRDYTLKYENDNTYLPGRYGLTICGIGDYADTVGNSYEIYTTTGFYSDDFDYIMPNGGKQSYAYTGKAIKVKPSSVTLNGKALKEGTDYTIAYSYDDVWVDEPIYMGHYEMYIIGQGAYKGESRPWDFSIVEQNSLAAAQVIMKDRFDYTGKAIKPKPVVVLNGKVLTSKDYQLTYYGSEYIDVYGGYKQISKPKNAGNYRVIITPKKSTYVDSTSAYYFIAPIDLADDETISVSLKKETVPYSGKAKNPTVVVKNISGKKAKTVKAKDNYTVSYAQDAIAMGNYSVTVSGEGNYTGDVTLKYQVGPANAKIKKLSAGSKSFTVQWKKVAKNNKGYQVRYSVNKDMTKAKTKTIKKAKTVKTTVSKLKAGKKYFVQVRTMNKVDGVTVYGNWTAAKAITTK